MRYCIFLTAIFFVLGCYNRNLNLKENVCQKYEDFDCIVEMVALRNFKKAEPLLGDYLNKRYPNEEKGIYFIGGRIRMFQLDSGMQPVAITDEELSLRAKQDEEFFYNEAPEICRWYELAIDYKPTEIEATMQLFSLFLEQYRIKPTHEIREKVILYGSRLVELLKYSAQGYLIRQWLQENAQKEIINPYPLSKQDEYGGIQSDEKRLSTTMKDIELFKKADMLFQERDFDTAIEYYKYSAYNIIHPEIVSLPDERAPYVFNTWSPEDGEVPNEDKWKNITLHPLALKKIAKCYHEKAKLVDNNKSISTGIKSISKIEYYKTAIFYYWLSTLYQNKLLESNKKHIAELRQKIKELESQLKQDKPQESPPK